MRAIDFASQFKKDYKKVSVGRFRRVFPTEFENVVTTLAADEMLDARYRDHELIGNCSGYRECHIKPDLLLIYKREDTDRLWLARLGSHSQIFK